MIRAWLRNPWETALAAALAVAGVFWRPALATAGVLFCALEIVAGIRRSPGPRWWPSMWPDRSDPLTILYDGVCVLCTRSKSRLERWPTARSMRFLALDSPEARARGPAMAARAYRGAMHVVEEGKVYSAHEGWYRIMRRGPLPWALVAAATPVWMARPIYAWIARNRYRWFGKICETGTCKVHPPESP